MRRTRNSKFGLTIDEVMEQLEPLLERIRVPAREVNREDINTDKSYICCKFYQ